MIGFVITRTTGPPKATCDTGNWSETIAVRSLSAEVLVILISTVALHRARHRQLIGSASSEVREHLVRNIRATGVDSIDTSLC